MLTPIIAGKAGAQEHWGNGDPIMRHSRRIIFAAGCIGLLSASTPAVSLAGAAAAAAAGKERAAAPAGGTLKLRANALTSEQEE